jgi:large subunit ribosomal protein L21
MYAIVEISGMQFKAAKNATICVPKLNIEPGKKVEFDRVLLVADGKNIQVGTPIVADVLIHATVIDHLKDDKVLVFKKKRRKNYRVLRGHREQYTRIKIDQIRIGKAGAGQPEEVAPKKSASPAVKKETKSTKKTPVKKTASSAKAKKTPSRQSKKKEA